MRFSSIPAIKLLFTCAVFPVLAQSADPMTLPSADLELAHNKIVVTTSLNDKDFLAAVPALAKPENWEIKLSGVDIPIESVALDLPNGAIDLRYTPGAISVVDSSDIPKGELAVTYLPATAKCIVPTGSDAHGPGGKASFASCFAWQLTKNKKKADIDISGGLQAGVNAKPQYFWSVKAICPFVLGAGAKYGEIGPSFTGEASQQRNADPDSLKAGITYCKLIAPPHTRNGWILSADALSYEFERNVKKEAVLNAGKIQQQQFLEKNTNLMWTGMARYVSAWPKLNWTLGFAGFEAGKALTRTIKRDSQNRQDQTVARLHFDLNAYRTFFRDGKPLVTFHGSHTLRLPFYKEPFTKVDENGGRMFMTKRPRQWTLIELVFLLSDGAGINVQYKHGSLPPSFEFVDHQVTIGFNFLLKRRG